MGSCLLLVQSSAKHSPMSTPYKDSKSPFVLLIKWVRSLFRKLFKKPVDVQSLQEKADAGDRDAQHELGLIYTRGEDVRQDDIRAMEYFRHAADGGHAEAIYTIGCLYHHGRGVSADLKAAIECYGGAEEF